MLVSTFFFFVAVVVTDGIVAQFLTQDDPTGNFRDEDKIPVAKIICAKMRPTSELTGCPLRVRC